MLKMEKYMHCALSLVSTLSLFLSSSGHKHALSPKSIFLVLVQYSLPQFKVFEEFLNARTLLQQKRTTLVLPNKLIDAHAILSDWCVITCDWNLNSSLALLFIFSYITLWKGQQILTFRFLYFNLYLLNLDSAVKSHQNYKHFLQLFHLDHPIFCCTQISYFDPLVVAPPATGCWWVPEDCFNMQFKDQWFFYAVQGVCSSAA